MGALVVAPISSTPAAGVDVMLDGSVLSFRTFLTAGTVLADSSFKYRAGFPAVSDSSYLYLTDGAHNLKILPLGGTTPVLTQDITVAAGKSYTGFVIDSLAKVGFLLVEDALPTTKQGKAFVRVAHLAPNAGSFDIVLRYVKTVNGVLTTLDSTSFGSNLPYKTVSNFIEAKATSTDSLTVEFRKAGTLTSAVVQTKSLLVPGRCYTIVAVGKAAPLETRNFIHGR